MIVGLLGDTHGNHTWIKFAARQFQTRGIATVIQVGDLGVDGSKRGLNDWAHTNKYLRLRDITFLVAPGNHEDYDHIDSLPVDPDGWQRLGSNVLLAPRGLRTELGGRTVVWLGGAGSVDRSYLQQVIARGGNGFWWPQEALTDADAASVVAGGHADVMVGHDAPEGVWAIESRLSRSAHHWDPEDLAYASDSRGLYTRAVAAVEPDLALHGHFHFPVDDTWTHPESGHVTHVFGLGKDWDYRSGLGTLDTDTLEVSFLDVSDEVSPGVALD